MEEDAALRGRLEVCGPKRVRMPRLPRALPSPHDSVAASVEERPMTSEECQGHVRTSSCEGTRWRGATLFWMVLMWVVMPVSACLGGRPLQYTCLYANLWRNGTCGSAGRGAAEGAYTAILSRDSTVDGASSRGPAISACIRSSGGNWLRLARRQATRRGREDQWEPTGGGPWFCGDRATIRRGIHPPHLLRRRPLHRKRGASSTWGETTREGMGRIGQRGDRRGRKGSRLRRGRRGQPRDGRNGGAVEVKLGVGRAGGGIGGGQ